MEVEVPRGEIQCKIRFVGESKVEKTSLIHPGQERFRSINKIL